MVFKKTEALKLEKHSVRMWVYNCAEGCPQAGIAYQETETGHAQEFYHDKSAFVFYIIEGRDTWVIEDEEYPVESSDVVFVPPGKRFYYKGRFKQICITAPAWEEKFERHVRFVDL